MKKLILLGIATLLVLSNHAYADDGNLLVNYPENNFYARVLGGANWMHTTLNQGIHPHFHVGYIVAGCLGFYSQYGFSVEAEYAFRRNSQSRLRYYGQTFAIGGHVQSSSIMANLLCDFSLCPYICAFRHFRPYIGGGVGYDTQQFKTKTHGFALRTHKKGFAWQILAGLARSLWCHSEIALEYKFHQGPLHHMRSNALMLAYTYKFGWGFCNRTTCICEQADYETM